jgi:hypothetical protein
VVSIVRMGGTKLHSKPDSLMQNNQTIESSKI